MNVNSVGQPVRSSGRPARLGAATRRGFTLVELGIVVVIIGILVASILAASYQGIQRAQEKATQALIAKLDQGVTERLDALLSQTVEPNGTHEYLAAIVPTGFPLGPASPTPWGLTSPERAAVIARLDYIKAEMPDVFFIQNNTDYPMNFAALGYPYPGTNTENFILPLGHAVYDRAPLGGYRPGSKLPDGTPYNYGLGANYIVDPNSGRLKNGSTPAEWTATSTGIYGASYTARGAFAKVLGLPQRAYDGTDNDRNGLVDEWTVSETGDPNTVAIVSRLVSNHQHQTARSECLYAFLVAGVGPLGNAFSRDDFLPAEVADTDNDGLPEFVDAWGHPLQFFRWPIHYRSGVQRGAVNLERFDGQDNDGLAGPDNPEEGFVYGTGSAAFVGATDPRAVNPLDPNALLIAPGWWSRGFNSLHLGASLTDAGGILSNPAAIVSTYFTSLVDYNAGSGAAPTDRRQFWDRTASARAAYFSRFLIVSGGPDEQLGVAMLGQDYSGFNPPAPGGVAFPTTSAETNALLLLTIENNAASLSPARSGTSPYYTAPSDATTLGLSQFWNQDDISNHTLRGSSGAVR